MPIGSLVEGLLATERLALADFAMFLRRHFGARLRILRLFGTRARGAGSDGSDLDVLAVVDDLTLGERREIWECTGELLARHRVIVGGMAMSTAAWQHLRARERRIIHEIDPHGVDL